MLSSSQIREGVQAGLIRVEFTGASATPVDYLVEITNGSGTRSTTVSATRQSTAVAWAAQWAKTAGPGWAFRSITTPSR
jgi:hypothetical protein